MERTWVTIDGNEADAGDFAGTGGNGGAEDLGTAAATAGAGFAAFPPSMVNGWLHLGQRHLAPGGNAGRLIDWRQFGHSIRSDALKR